MNHADYWIDKLHLSAHPEGGYFRETYRAEEKIAHRALPDRFNGDRNYSTAIHFLLKGNQKSLFHRIQADEMWHFYSGSALTIHVITPDGKYSTLPLGPDAESGQCFQQLVPANTWFGATVNDSSSFSLVGCTVAPGFDFADFEFGNKNWLIKLCPAQKSLIESLTKDE
ncbi:MAG: cupin domain-containing protein [Deferribacteres bacterium]|nr:cupin domain-containing protein [candidate division KSB1 bacterium]MCB9503572.1 cupin domain-containing protein [Deferribacteres bacterium]